MEVGELTRLRAMVDAIEAAAGVVPLVGCCMHLCRKYVRPFPVFFSFHRAEEVVRLWRLVCALCSSVGSMSKSQGCALGRNRIPRTTRARLW